MRVTGEVCRPEIEVAGISALLANTDSITLDVSAGLIADLQAYIAASVDSPRVNPGVFDLLVRFKQAFTERDAPAGSACLKQAAVAIAKHRRRILLIASGSAGSGKSTLAARLALRWGLLHLQTDDIRKRLAGLDPGARTGSPLYGGIYTPEASRVTYHELNRQALTALKQNRPVVMDGSFLARAQRAAAVDVARETCTPVIIMRCFLDPEEQRRRIRARVTAGDSISEGGLDVMAAHEKKWEPILADEADGIAEINTGTTIDEVEAEALRQLWRTILARQSLDQILDS